MFRVSVILYVSVNLQINRSVYDTRRSILQCARGEGLSLVMLVAGGRCSTDP